VTTTLSSVVWVLGVAILLAVIALAAVMLRRRAPAATVEPVTPPPDRPRRSIDAPMSGLESALAQMTDRDGRPMSERIDAEGEHVDDLRRPDDTGLLLRHALDHVEHHDVDAAGPVDDEAPDETT